MPRRCAELVEDVAAASAAYLYNLLPAVAALPAPQAFERLKDHIEAAILAYLEFHEHGFPDPSEN